MNAFTIYIVDSLEDTRSRLADALDSQAQWLGHSSVEELARAIDSGAVPAVAITGPNVPHAEVMALGESVQAEQLAVGIVQVTKKLDPEQLREALRVDVVDVVEDEVELGQLPEAMRRAGEVALRRMPLVVDDEVVVKPEITADVVAVVAGKRGVGASLLATNLAIALADQGRPTALLDLDARGGDLAIMLQHRPEQTVRDAVARIDYLDANAIDGYLAHVQGIRLLAAPLDATDQHVDGTTLDRLVELIAEHVDVIVVDVGDSWSATAHHVMASADMVLVVSSMEVTSARGTRRVLAQMSDDGLPFERVLLVANQADAPTGLAPSDFAKTLNAKFDATIPVDKHAARSINEGEPLVNRRRSKTGKAIRELATLVAGHLDMG